MKAFLLSSCVVGALTIAPLMAADEDHKNHEHDKRFQEANTVFMEIMGAGDKAIPQDLLEKAKATLKVK